MSEQRPPRLRARAEAIRYRQTEPREHPPWIRLRRGGLHASAVVAAVAASACGSSGRAAPDLVVGAGHRVAEIVIRVPASGSRSSCTLGADPAATLENVETREAALAALRGDAAGPRTFLVEEVAAAIGDLRVPVPELEAPAALALGIPESRTCASGCLLLPPGAQMHRAELTGRDGQSPCVPPPLLGGAAVFIPSRGINHTQQCLDESGWHAVRRVTLPTGEAGLCATAMNWSAEVPSGGHVRVWYTTRDEPGMRPADPPAPSSALPSQSGLRCAECERRAYRERIAESLRLGAWGSLEEEVARLRRERPRFSSGAPVLFDFYIGLSTIGRLGDRVLLRLGLWEEALPDSPTPGIARMRYHISEAARARGSAYASSVTEEGRRGFLEHSRIVWELGTALQAGVEDPVIFDSMLTVGFTLDQYEPALRAFEQGVLLDPAYDHIYVVMARLLLPRWYGSVEALAKFADDASRRTRDELGESMYARIAAEALVLYAEDNRGVMPAFSWHRMKRGFEDLDRLHPDSSFILHAYARSAVLYEDFPSADAVFRRLDEQRWDADAAEVWGARYAYESARQQAAAATR